jgi:hypothetical protein
MLVGVVLLVLVGRLPFAFGGVTFRVGGFLGGHFWLAPPRGGVAAGTAKNTPPRSNNTGV